MVLFKKGPWVALCHGLTLSFFPDVDKGEAEEEVDPDYHKHVQLLVHVTSFSSISYCSNNEYWTQKRTQSERIHSVISFYFFK